MSDEPKKQGNREVTLREFRALKRRVERLEKLLAIRPYKKK